MAGGGGRSLEATPTWAVALVCLILVAISIILEHFIHLIAKWLAKQHKRALFEALEKIKAELMLLGFISLLLTVLQGTIANICVPESVGNSWLPCPPEQENNTTNTVTISAALKGSHGRRLLRINETVGGFRRILAGGETTDKCAEKGKVSLISNDGIHQLHIFIFVLAVAHILYCIVILALGRLKMRKWKAWELETKTAEYQFSHDPARFRFARDTSFGRRHLNFWSKSPILIWIVCFFRQFLGSVPKVDYLTLRHGFITAHLAQQSWNKFDFQKYIKRSLEEDFKVVVGISPTIWFFAVLFLLSNTDGLHSYLWLPFIPLIIILLVGAKLQVIITKMAIRIMERGDVVRGVPVVQPTDDLFWFSRPRFLLFLIHFVLFQNAFQLAFFAWTWYQFGYPSCFHRGITDIVIRISMGILIEVLCSYVTLPLYALVTQMGSNMRPTIFNERVATALRRWHQTARRHIKESKKSGNATPVHSPSRPSTPTHGLSPVHLLQFYRSEIDSSQTSPRRYVSDDDQFDIEESALPAYNASHDSSSSHHSKPAGNVEQRGGSGEFDFPTKERDGKLGSMGVDFSFDKRQMRKDSK